MVLSATKKTSSIASITNQSTNGGPKKAGLPHLIARDSWASVALRGTSQRLSVLKVPVISTTRQSRPIGSLPMNFR